MSLPMQPLIHHKIRLHYVIIYFESNDKITIMLIDLEKCFQSKK